MTQRRSAWTIAVPVIWALAGLLFATSAGAARGTDLRGGRADLPALIRTQAEAVERRSQENAQARADIDDRLAELPGASDLTRLRDEQNRLGAAAGLEPASGPAVQVSLDDARLNADSLPEGVGVDDIVVHQQDVQAVVNALWAAGAEAMTIQDQRIISTSAVRCVGNTLILGGRVYAPPFVITAIGDQQALQAGLDRDPTVAVYRDYASRLGLGYQVRHLDAEFGGYTGTVDLVHARPVTQAGATSGSPAESPTGSPTP